MSALIYFAALGLILVFTHGHFGANHLLALMAIHAAFTGREMLRTEPSPQPTRVEVTLGLLFVFALFLVASDQLIYPANAAAHARLRQWLTWLPLLVAAAFVALSWRWPAERAGRIALYAACGAIAVVLVAARILVPQASPQPHIDVWTSSVDAVKHFLSGNNPYSQQYVDIYGGRYDYKPGFPYLPGYLLWASGWAWLTGSTDVRVSLIAAEIASSGMLLGWLRTLGLDWASVCALVVLWLGFPIDLFVLEQAWLDPLLVMAFAASTWAITARRWVLGGALLGFALAVKQYAPIGVAFFILYTWRVAGLRVAVRLAGAAAVVFLAICVPFLIAEPQSFWRSVAGTAAGLLPRLDALTFPAFIAHKTGVTDPAGVRRLFAPFAYLSVAIWAAMLIWFWRRKAPTLRELFVGASVSYGWMLLFAKQSFCNYYYFLSFFLLAVTACAWAPARQEDPPA